MLEYREIDFEKDIHEAVSLIVKGLNNSYTETFFRWKHIENPFGRSYGLVVLDEGKMVGLRMFMFWQLFKGDDIITALRPVDTVVHENYRGKGIFKKLTLRGLEECKGKYDLIFNTPNDNSLPGYLKMGWKKIQTNSFKLGVFNPISASGNINISELSRLSQLVTYSDRWETNKTISFFQWRYKGEKYSVVEYRSAFLIYSLAKLKIFTEIIIHECHGRKEELNTLVKSICKKHSTIFVYYYHNIQTNQLQPLWARDRKSSIVVIREDKPGVSGNVNLSLGDLEGKL